METENKNDTIGTLVHLLSFQTNEAARLRGAIPASHAIGCDNCASRHQASIDLDRIKQAFASARCRPIVPSVEEVEEHCRRLLADEPSSINPGNTCIPSVEEVFLAVGCPPGGDLISCIRYDKAAAKADRIKAGGLSDHLAGIRAALGCKEGESALAAIERLKRPGWEPTGSVMAEIGNERRRQQTEEGWSDGHDDSLKNQELPRAAACYAIGNTGGIPGGARMWPFQMETWKPADKRRNLIKAGALIIAEVERLDRAAAGA